MTKASVELDSVLMPLKNRPFRSRSNIMSIESKQQTSILVFGDLEAS